MGRGCAEGDDMGKNKHKNRNQSPPQPSAGASASAQKPQTPAPQPIVPSPSDPGSSIQRLSDHALAGAEAADIESIPPAPPGADQLAVRAHEALHLLNAQLDRAKRREAQATEAEEKALKAERRHREEQANAERAAREADAERRAAEELRRKFETRSKDLDDRDKSLKDRELNAEAGFIKERRESLQALDREAAAVRGEVEKLREQVSADRVAWEAEKSRRVDELRVDTDRVRQSAAAENLREKEQIAAERADVEALRAAVGSRERRVRDDEAELSERRTFEVARAEAKVAERLQALECDGAALKARLDVALKRAGDLEGQLAAKEAAARRAGHRSVEDLLQEIDNLTRERDQLATDLDTRPGADALRRLRDLEEQKERWAEERRRLVEENASLRGRAETASVAVCELEHLRDAKSALEAGRQMLRAELDDLKKQVHEYTEASKSESVFPELTRIEAAADARKPLRLGREIPDLRVFADDLRHRLAVDPTSETRLFYDARDVRSLLGGLAMSPLHLLQGISGTGKTSLPIALARAVGGGCKVVPVQAGWRDRQDLLGHHNAFEDLYQETEFVQALYEAQCAEYRDRVYVIVLDEMNLSHPEQYFADLLSALERKEGERELELTHREPRVYPKLLRAGRFLSVPSNVWFFGTANHDETTKDFADKTYDRSHVMELPREHERFQIRDWENRAPLGVGALRAAFARAASTYVQAAADAYRAIEKHLSQPLSVGFRIGWGNRLDRHVRAYVPVVIAAGGSLCEAVDHVVATKLVRKIHDRHDNREEDLRVLRKATLGLFAALDKGWDAAKESRALRGVDEEIRRIDASAEFGA